MIIGLVRFSYLNVFEPRKTPNDQLKYSVCCLVPKSDKKLVNTILEGIEAARGRGVETGKFNKVQAKGVRIPLRDGDKELEAGTKQGREYEGMFFFNCTSDNKPGIVGPNGKPLMDESEFFSGCWGYVDIGLFPYSASGNRGIGAGLNNIMLKKQDERLDGRQSAEDAFKDVSDDDVNDELV